MGRLDLSDLRFVPGGVLVHDRRLLVTGGAGFQPPPARPHATGLALVDIADPARPRLLEAMLVSGAVVDASLPDGAAVVTVAAGPYLEFRGPSSAADEATALAFNRAVVACAPVEAWLPRRILDADTPFDPTLQVRLMDLTAPGPAAPRPLEGTASADFVASAGGHLVLTIGHVRGRLHVGSHDATTPSAPERAAALTYGLRSRSSFAAVYLPAERTLVIPGFARHQGRHAPAVFAVRVGAHGALTPAGLWRAAGPVSVPASEKVASQHSTPGAPA